MKNIEMNKTQADVLAAMLTKSQSGGYSIGEVRTFCKILEQIEALQYPEGVSPQTAVLMIEDADYVTVKKRVETHKWEYAIPEAVQFVELFK